MHEAVGSDAASVAAQLLAFCREPVRHRPRLIHGDEAVAGGHFVFKFAQGKFPHRILRDFSRVERSELRQAARAFIREVCFWEGATHYQILCVPTVAKRDLIKGHYHLLMALIHPDRQDRSRNEEAHDDALTEAWPVGCAQRVNRAYEVLCDEGRRRDYDGGLHKTASSSAVHMETGAAAPRPAARNGRGKAGTGRVVKPLFVVTSVVAALLFFQIWWVSDIPGEHSILERAFPLHASSQWMRDVLAGAGRPKFLAVATPPMSAPDDAASQTDAKEPERFSLFEPLLKSLRGENMASAPARPGAGEARAMEIAPRAQQVVADGTRAQGERPSRPAETLVAQSPPQPQPATAARQPAASASPIRSEDIEILIARLVSYYEAGDVDNLMGLVDSRETGAWRAIQTRHAFYEFFSATKQRRLRMDNLSWQIAPQSAQAKGNATLRAEYVDGRGAIERPLDVEMDIALRDGQLRFARLALFPNGR